MLALIAIGLLLAASGALLGVHLWRPRFPYYWLMAAVTVLLVWPLLLLAQRSLPLEIPLGSWGATALFPFSPVLLLDYISWPFALALGGLTLAVILTDVTRATGGDWAAWAGGLALAALGLVAVLAGNPLTLLLAWAALDLFELVVLLGQVTSNAERAGAAPLLAARVAGMVLVMWSGVVSQSLGTSLTFMAIHPDASVYLLLGAGLRLGILPLHVIRFRQRPQRRGLGTLLRLVPVASSLTVLARTANTGATPSFAGALLGFASLAALYGAVSWLRSEDELDGRAGWILSLASLALIAAVRSETAATVTLGLGLLLAGGLLFVSSLRHARLRPLLLLGLFGWTALPFTPGAEAARLFTRPEGLATPGVLTLVAGLNLLTLALLAAGYVRHSLRQAEPPVGLERWVWLIYPLGLLLLPLSQALAQAGSRPPEAAAEGAGLPWWPAVALGLLLAGFSLTRRSARRGWARLAAPLGAALAANWSLERLYGWGWRGFRLLGQGVSTLSRVLEGEGGILWTLLLIVLLLAAFLTPGGGT